MSRAGYLTQQSLPDVDKFFLMEFLMTRFSKFALCASALAAGVAAMPASATILTFDIDTSQPSSILGMSQAYGDNVTSTTMGVRSYGVGAEGFTPNVSVSYAGNPTTDLTRWTTSYGDLVNVLENEADGQDRLTITLAADAGFNAKLFGFDMAGWPTTDYVIPFLKVLDGSNNVLFSQANAFIEGTSGHSTFSFGSGLSAQSLTIYIDLTGLGGNSDNIGIDNIRFGQSVVAPAVPETSTWAMMIVGFGAVGFGMRRRRTASVSFA